jgi:hypothetical protein
LLRISDSSAIFACTGRKERKKERKKKNEIDASYLIQQFFVLLGAEKWH